LRLQAAPVHDHHCSAGNRQFSEENMMSSLFKSALVAVVVGSVAMAPAWADNRGYHGGGPRGSHGGGGWGALGLALFGTAVYLAATAPPPPYHPAPVYSPQIYDPQVYVQPPVVLTQTAPPPVPAPEQQWWYYCAASAGYYPYIRTCPTGWTRVSPVPPGQ